MKRKFSISDILSKISRENLKKRFKEAAQMINLIYRNYSDGETQMLSTSLTYFSMLAIFPIVALILGITKGFGLDRLFIRKIFEIVPQNEGMVRTVLDVANKLLVSTEGSILTGVGVVILINSAIKVLMVLEDSFNKIWHVNKNRSFTRRIIDYIYRTYILYSNYSNKFICNRKSWRTSFGKNPRDRAVYKTDRSFILYSPVYTAFLSNSKYECKVKAGIYFGSGNCAAMFYSESGICISAVVYNKI